MAFEINGNMKANKGMFQDPEVGTEAHDDIQMWLTNSENVAMISWLLYQDKVKEFDVNNDTFRLNNQINIEAPMVQKNFLLGFADAYIFNRESFFIEYLIEIKTGNIYFGEILRQLKAYRSVLSHRVRACLIHKQEIDETTKNAFKSQGVMPLFIQGEKQSYEFKDELLPPWLLPIPEFTPPERVKTLTKTEDIVKEEALPEFDPNAKLPASFWEDFKGNK